MDVHCLIAGFNRSNTWMLPSLETARLRRSNIFPFIHPVVFDDEHVFGRGGMRCLYQGAVAVGFDPPGDSVNMLGVGAAVHLDRALPVGFSSR